MPDLLVRDIDPEVFERMRKVAEVQGKSLAQAAREALAETFVLSQRDAWAEIDRFRESIGPVRGDSTEIIRRMRERVRPGD